MKKTGLILCLIAVAAFLAAPQQSAAAAKDAVSMCLSVIVPTLFPFLVLSSLALSFGLADVCERLFAPIFKPLFGLSAKNAAAVILGCACGFPVGAKTAVSLYTSGKCTKTEAERTLLFCSCVSPAFAVGTVGAVIWQNVGIGWLCFAVQLLSALIVGLLFSRTVKGKPEIPSPAAPASTKTETTFFEAVVSAVTSSAMSIGTVCAFIVFFSVLAALLDAFGIIAIIAGIISRLFGLDFYAVKALLFGLIEFSTGAKMLGTVPLNAQKLVMTAIVLGFSGVCVCFQSLSFIIPAKLSPKPYILGNLAHAVIAALLQTAAILILYKNNIF